MVDAPVAEVTVTESLVEHVRTWLGKDGLAFFAEMMRDHGTYAPVLSVPFGDDSRGPQKRFPHPVHFREGMQVRNAMRGHPDCASWTAHDFDGAWQPVVGLCLAEAPSLPCVINTGATDR